MLETIRQFAEEQLVASGAATEVRTAHAGYFAGRETDIMALWDSPRQREAYDWFTAELANLRTAFRWAADHGDLDGAAAIATYAGFLGLVTEKYEPSGWAEELIEPARAADHPRLGEYVCGRIAVLYDRTHRGRRPLHQRRPDSSDRAPRYGAAPIDGMIGGAYMYSGHPERCIEWCRAQLERGPDTPSHQGLPGFGLVHAGFGEEAMAAANGLIEAAEANRKPVRAVVRALRLRLCLPRG